MSTVRSTRIDDSRGLLVERVAASSAVKSSARLRDLLVYLCDRVLQGGVEEIHEREVGHQFFGRPPDYDTTADNIVRVHVSLLRKRLAEYFSREGAEEPVLIEIPKGNYAPVFRERATAAAPGAVAPGTATPGVAAPGEAARFSLLSWPVGALAAAAVFFAATTLFLLLKERPTRRAEDDEASRPTVHLLWSQVFRANGVTDIVLDDATIGLYQDLTRHPIPLSEYYDRSYLRRLPEIAEGAKLDRDALSAVVIRRHSSSAAVIPLLELFAIGEKEHTRPSVQFARDYSFRGLKTNNVVLLGSSQSNPWVEPFESHLGLRWVYDKELEASYPIDTWADEASRTQFRPAVQAGETREGYCGIALVSNLGGSGSVLLIAATGGRAIAACVDFLTDEQAVAGLHRKLTGATDTVFPFFEALLRVKGSSALPLDLSIPVCRPPRK
jgi:hypothetical protein